MSVPHINSADLHLVAMQKLESTRRLRTRPRGTTSAASFVMPNYQTRHSKTLHWSLPILIARTMSIQAMLWICWQTYTLKIKRRRRRRRRLLIFWQPSMTPLGNSTGATERACLMQKKLLQPRKMGMRESKALIPGRRYVLQGIT